MLRTMLYLPGNNPNMLTRGHLFGSDGVILDLEDAVADGYLVPPKAVSPP